MIEIMNTSRRITKLQKWILTQISLYRINVSKTLCMNKIRFSLLYWIIFIFWVNIKSIWFFEWLTISEYESIFFFFRELHRFRVIRFWKKEFLKNYSDEYNSVENMDRILIFATADVFSDTGTLEYHKYSSEKNTFAWFIFVTCFSFLKNILLKKFFTYWLKTKFSNNLNTLDTSTTIPNM